MVVKIKPKSGQLHQAYLILAVGMELLQYVPVSLKYPVKISDDPVGLRPCFIVVTASAIVIAEFFIHSSLERMIAIQTKSFYGWSHFLSFKTFIVEERSIFCANVILKYRRA